MKEKQDAAADRFEELQAMVESFESDFRKFYGKKNKTAGIRLRKNMQMLRCFAKEVRAEVQQLSQGLQKGT